MHSPMQATLAITYPLSHRSGDEIAAKLVVDVVEEFRAKGIAKPVVASLSGDVEVEEASGYLYQHGVIAYPYTTEKPVAVLGAKYRWARAAGLLSS